MLPNYQKILYATDLSENARAAFRHAVSFAKAYHAKIFLIHIVPAMEFDEREQIFGSFGYASKVLGEVKDESKIKLVTAQIVEKIRERLKKFAEEELGHGSESMDWLGGIEVVVGKNAVAEILKASNNLDADLLVFGSHSKGFIQQTLLGSVAESVLQQSRRPTLIVPLVA